MSLQRITKRELKERRLRESRCYHLQPDEKNRRGTTNWCAKYGEHLFCPGYIRIIERGADRYIFGVAVENGCQDYISYIDGVMKFEVLK